MFREVLALFPYPDIVRGAVLVTLVVRVHKNNPMRQVANMQAVPIMPSIASRIVSTRDCVGGGLLAHVAA